MIQHVRIQSLDIDGITSRRNAVAPLEQIAFRAVHFALRLIRTCTLAEAHSLPGRVNVKASRPGGRSALTASSSCSREPLSVPRSWLAAECFAPTFKALRTARHLRWADAKAEAVQKVIR